MISFDVSFVSVCFDGCVTIAVAVAVVVVVSKICCQCLSCCAGDIWENSVGENGGGGVGGGLIFSRFCGDGPLP